MSKQPWKELHLVDCIAGNALPLRKEIFTKRQENCKKNMGDFAPYAKRFTAVLNPVFEKYPDFAQLLDYIAKAQCGGCRKEKCKFYKNCKVRSCAEAKGVDFCYQCDEFPCDHTGLDENLRNRSVEINRRIKKIGITAYYDEIKDKPRY